MVVAGCRDMSLRCGGRWPVSDSGQGEHRCPRSREGTHPDRCSCVRNTETPSGSGPLVRSADREESSTPGREQDDQEANVGSRKATGNRGSRANPSSWPPRITGRIPDLVSGRESGLTWSGESGKRKTTMAPEPEDKLDAATTPVGVVNGPEDAILDWHAVDWRRVEANVRRLRQRIFTASKAGDLARVRRLQKLMLRSRSNTLLSVRRVTERNAGRLTAGVDGEVVLTPEAKLTLADKVAHPAEPFKAMPVRRVYIPKAGSSAKRRPLGIPVLTDRVHQARVVKRVVHLGAVDGMPPFRAGPKPRTMGGRPDCGPDPARLLPLGTPDCTEMEDPWS